MRIPKFINVNYVVKILNKVLYMNFVIKRVAEIIKNCENA